MYGNATGDLFGCSIDVTAEGNNIVLGLPGSYNYTDRPGYVHEFTPWIVMTKLGTTLGIRPAKTSSGKQMAMSLRLVILFLSLRMARQLQSALNPNTAPTTIRVT
jgi:hypothetical protein